MGRQGFNDFTSRCLHENKGVPLSVPDLVSKSKKKKTGNYVSKKFEKIMDIFTSKKTQTQETQPDTSVDDSRLYYEAAGGYDKKGRVYGMGSAAPMYYERPAAARHSSAETYAPGIVTQLTQAMARDRQVNLEVTEELRRELKDMDDRLSRLERLVMERLGSTPPEGCSQGTRPQDRDDRFDQGPGGADKGMGSTPCV